MDRTAGLVKIHAALLVPRDCYPLDGLVDGEGLEGWHLFEDE
jgi:hypothetical protein